MRVRIYPVALGKIVNHAASSPETEVAGLLIGREAGSWLEVWDAATGPQFGTAGYVKLDEEFMARVAEALHEARIGLYIVGWYHSHPGLSVFMSPVDVRTQMAYQSLYPKAIALVIDPSKYLRTGHISNIDFRVFRVSDDGAVVSIPVAIGMRRERVIESTIAALRGYGKRNELGEAAADFLGKARRAISGASKRLLKWEVRE